MRITSDSLAYFNVSGYAYIHSKVTLFLRTTIAYNSDNKACVVACKKFQNMLKKPENLGIVIDKMNDLDDHDFFGTEGWEHHAGLED